MNDKIHKFKQGNEYILLDINSGAVHLIDKMIFDIMDTFDGNNDAEVVDNLKNRYDVIELNEALGELHDLIDSNLLFAPDIDVPPTFKQTGIVKSLCLMVAQDCNLRCKYCFGDGGSYGSNRAIMNEKVGRAAVDFIIKNSKSRRHCEIDFFGGEPLINLNTVKAVTEYVRQREAETGKIFKLTLTTNGMLLNDSAIKWLNDNNISLVLSLDGRKEIHDAMRPDSAGHGSYDRALKNFKNLVK
ncbi:MAG: 4Fe-4S cluster-binding domain-containing protein, partial [Selenomonadaceae bacterium]|nr:4Fe-4S cluster-binding domain-containing protein [Selenomonadaceae bacterium]